MIIVNQARSQTTSQPVLVGDTRKGAGADGAIGSAIREDFGSRIRSPIRGKLFRLMNLKIFDRTFETFIESINGTALRLLPVHTFAPISGLHVVLICTVGPRSRMCIWLAAIHKSLLPANVGSSGQVVRSAFRRLPARNYMDSRP